MNTTPQDPATRLKAEEQNWLMLCHLSALSMFFIPAGHLLGPLIIWLWKRAEIPAVDEAGKAALNFQLSMTIYFAISALLILALVGVFMIGLLLILEIVFVVMAAVRVSNGEMYDYPWTIRFLK